MARARLRKKSGCAGQDERRLVNPDVAIILEADIPGDVPGIKPEESNVKLGQGPTLMMYDARMIPNLRLRDLTGP